MLYEVRKNTGSWTNHGPEIGGLISKHRTIKGAWKSSRNYYGLNLCPVIWVREGKDLRLLNNLELDELICYQNGA